MKNSWQNTRKTLLRVRRKRYIRSFSDDWHTKISRYHGIHTATLNLSERVYRFDKRLGYKIEHCGAFMKQEFTTCEHHHPGKISQHIHCDFRLCPGCAARRSDRLEHVLGPVLDAFINSHNYFSYMITLTYKDTEHIPSASKMARDRMRFFKLKIWKDYGLVGGYYTLELHPGKNSGLFHPHPHFLIFTKIPLETYLDKKGDMSLNIVLNQKISDAWNRTNKETGFIVHGCEFDNDFSEFLKYVAKSSKAFSDSQLQEFTEWQKGVRFRGLFGQLYKDKFLRSELTSSENLYRTEDIPHPVCPVCGCKDFTITFYRWNSMAWKYVHDYSFQPSRASPPLEGKNIETFEKANPVSAVQYRVDNNVISTII